ncbi:GLE1-domain-containing protein [Xylariaceae sp. FL0594]|nr:GLE1-domain-containing protein [Xylariaceae sp. FL0594]
MSGSSPATRRSRQWSSPARGRLSDILCEGRHTELSHQDALAFAQLEHERVRLAAIKVYEDHEFEEETRRVHEKENNIRQLQRIEEERIRNEERLRAEEERLRALKAKAVPKLPPEPAQQAPPAAVTSTPASTTTAQSSGSQPSKAFAPTDSTAALKSTAPETKASSFLQPSATSPPTLQTGGVKAAQSAPVPIASMLNSSPFASTTTTKPQAVAQPPPKPPIDDYTVIHQNLKKLRAFMAEQAKAVPELKARMGDMRREMRKSLGQFVTEKGGNKQQTSKIQSLFTESLSGTVPSALIDPSQFILDKQRPPVEGALHNEPQLPSLFLYLLNVFSKAVLNQFINECGAQPKAADPLGVIAAHVFSNKSHQWRGKPLIDIMMAKFRIVCPVVFGYRGSEKTEQGRARLGWRKEGNAWAPEQQHIDRMKGLAVGYAAISLRDFTKSPNTNPWPPSKYWTSLAKIVNTPPTEVSNTQCVVLRAMIEAYEERFLLFYGTAAIAALRTALVDFPSKVPVQTPGTAGLQVLAQMIKRDTGLAL